MATFNLPQIGVQAVVQGVQQFTKDIDSVNKAIDNSGKTSASAAKNVSPFSDALGEIAPVALAAVAAITAVIGILVALGKGFLELANRGVDVQQLGIAFDHLTASVSIDSQKLLKDLQTASDGTIANVDLLRTANAALLGVSGQFGTKFGQALPEFLKIAKVESDATGRSVNELFNNIVEGVKKGTPKLIENTGLVIEQKKAYQDYADSLGITVAQLSDTDRSMALLNATLTAGTAAIDSMSGSVESNADKLERISATTTNILDGIGVSLQPIFGTILDGVQTIINGLATFAPYVSLIFEFVGKIISKIVGVISGSFSNPNLAKNMFEGAAAVFGSFANGIIKTANELIFPAIIFIAKTIADFLIGLSPPPKGPLSVIDKGGENLMNAWLEGISGVSLDPVTKVAKEVSDALGNIGKESLVQVNNRLYQLDRALLPFQNRLDIIKSQFDALAAPAKAALDAIDRQTAELQDAAAQGNPQAVEKLRILDAQRQTIQDQLDLQQGIVDGAQIQLGLAQAQQAPERALLNIRQAQLEALAKLQPKATAAGGGADKLPKEKKAPAGAAPIDTNTGVTGGGGVTVPGAPSVLDTIGGQDAIDQAKQGLKDAFTGQLDAQGLATLGLDEKSLGTQIARINSVDIGQKISDKFKGISDAFDPSVAGSVANNIWQFFNGDAKNPNSLAGIVNGIGNSLNIDNLVGKLTEEFAWITDPKAEGSPANIFATLTGDAKVDGSIASFLVHLPDSITDSLSNLTQTVFNAFNGVIGFFTGTGPNTLSGYIDVAIEFFKAIPDHIIDALKGVGASVQAALITPVVHAINSLIGLIETGLRGLIGKMADFVQSIANALGDQTPDFIKNAISSLHAAAGGVNFPRIPEGNPAIGPPRAAAGGIFSSGLLTVGEKGTETLFNASKVGVIPHELTNVLMSLQSILAQPQAQPVYAGGNNTTMNNSSSSFNFNGVQSDNDARRRYNYLRAGMR